LLALHTLNHLEKRLKKPISSLFDCITGVSAGGLIALGLVAPRPGGNGTAYSAQELVDFFTHNAAKVFQKTAAQSLAHKVPILGVLDTLFFSKYCNKSAQALYLELFGQTPMSSALIHTLVPAYNIYGIAHKGPRLKLFDSLSIKEHKAKDKNAHDFLMHEVALATSAIPTYFAPQRMHVLGEKEKKLSYYYLIDGGVAINNPTILAYSDLRSRYPDSPIHTLSLGVGTSPNIYNSVIKDTSPGTLAWLGKLGNLIVSPQLSVYNKLLKDLQKNAPKSGSYWRIQPTEHGQLSKFDDISPYHFKRIAETAEKMIEQNKHILDGLAWYLSHK